MNTENMKLTISLQAKHLKNVAGMFKGVSDPFAVITVLPLSTDATPKIVGKTEVIKNTLNPDWVTTFNVDYELGKPTNLLVKIFDEVRKGENISMGSVVFEVGHVLGSRGSISSKTIKGNKGLITLKIEKPEKDTGKLKLKMSGIKFKNFDGLFNKSDPFFEFRKKDAGAVGSNWNVVHRSSYIKNDLNPDWQEEILDLNNLCNGNLDELIILSVYDHEGDGKHELMGEVQTSVNGLIAAKKTDGFEMKRKGKVTGRIVVHVAEVLQGDSGNIDVDLPIAAMSNVKISPTTPMVRPPSSNKNTFVDYIKGGCEISLSVAIDFTGSNGDPRKPGTLHYRHPDGQLNDYEKAMKSIGTILAKYDSDKKFPVMGFGAKYGGVVRHCFQCGPEEEVDGVDGIINAYRATFASGLVMSGPTVFTEVIQVAAARAVSAQEEAKKYGKQKYSILLILTDGAVSDVAATARCIDSIDESPLSIVIVGIGNADFSGMQFLDDSSGDVDISQFVKFNEHRHNLTSLTSATLDEIPAQLESYFKRHNINPNPPVEVTEDEIVVEPEEEEIDLTIDFGSDGEVTYGSGGVYVQRDYS